LELFFLEEKNLCFTNFFSPPWPCRTKLSQRRKPQALEMCFLMQSLQ